MAVCPLTREEVLDMIHAEDLHIVSAAPSTGGTTLTRNDGVTFFIPDKLEDVTLQETPSDYIISVVNADGTRNSITIPKCRNYRDCNGNVLDNCERLVTCDDLEARNLIDCYDQNDFSIVPRMVDGEPTRCLEVKWDQLCVESEAITDPAGHQVVMCGPAGVKKIPPSNLLSELCFNSVPDLGEQCGTVDQLVLITENGCGRLAKTRQATQPQQALYLAQVAVPRLADNTGGFTLPDDFANPNLWYTSSDYVADGGVVHESGPYASNMRPAPGINNAKIVNSRFGAISFNNPCRRVYEFEVNVSQRRDADIQNAYESVSAFGWRYRVDGSAWQYASATGVGTLGIFGTDNGLANSRQAFGTITIPEGKIDFEVFYLGGNNGKYVKWGANTYHDGFGTPSPRAYLRRMA